MRDAQLTEMRERLLRAGVSPRRVRRMMAEIADHYDDLRREIQERGVSAEEADAEAHRRLGTEALIEGVLARPELRSWVRRWPSIALTVGPLLLYLALLTMMVLLLVGTVEISKGLLAVDISKSSVLQLFAQALLAAMIWVVPVLAAAGCCALALSRRAPASWAIVGIVLVAAVGALSNAQLELPPVVSQPQFGAGFGFSSEALFGPLLRMSITLTIVLVPYFWLRSAQTAG
jgi:hypothetical protein